MTTSAIIKRKPSEVICLLFEHTRRRRSMLLATGLPENHLQLPLTSTLETYGHHHRDVDEVKLEAKFGTIADTLMLA